jgi:hypothetical protein
MMQNFQFYTPTRVVFGKDTVSQVGTLVAAQHCRKALVHYGGKSAKASGLLDRVCDALRDAGVDFVLLGGVQPNPRLSLVREGIDLCRREGVDFLLAVGGGSVIDSAKAIGYGLANPCDVWDIYLKKAVPSACTPVGAVLTIAAAGSEMSDSSVITNEDGWLKRGFSSDLCRCRFAVMDPQLTETLPAYQTASGCTDILMHTMERYFGAEHGLALTDAMGEALMQTVIASARTLALYPHDYKARANVMWASSLSHNGLTGCGAVGDWACHQIEHELGGMFDVAHGAGLAAVWGSWARYVYRADPARFAQFAYRVMGVAAAESTEETALRGISAFEDFLRYIGMPTTIHDLGVDLTDEQIAVLAHKCTFQGQRTIGTFQVLQEADIAAIYRAAR